MEGSFCSITAVCCKKEEDPLNNKSKKFKKGLLEDST